MQALQISMFSKGHFVRLACLRHAASVHPEPGSNSPKKNLNSFEIVFHLTNSELTFCSVFKDHSCFSRGKANQVYQIHILKSIVFINFFSYLTLNFLFCEAFLTQRDTNIPNLAFKVNTFFQLFYIFLIFAEMMCFFLTKPH